MQDPSWSTISFLALNTYSNFLFCMAGLHVCGRHYPLPVTDLFYRNTSGCFGDWLWPPIHFTKFWDFYSTHEICHVLAPPFLQQFNGGVKTFACTFEAQMHKYMLHLLVEEALLNYLSRYQSTAARTHNPTELLRGCPHQTLLSLVHPSSPMSTPISPSPFTPGSAVRLQPPSSLSSSHGPSEVQPFPLWDPFCYRYPHLPPLPAVGLLSCAVGQNDKPHFPTPALFCRIQKRLIFVCQYYELYILSINVVMP